LGTRVSKTKAKIDSANRQSMELFSLENLPTAQEKFTRFSTLQIFRLRIALSQLARATKQTTKLPRIFVGFWRASCVSYCMDMGKPLAGKNIAILCTNGVEQSELVEPREALEKAGAQTDVVSPATTAQIHSTIYHEPGENFAWDVALSWANPDDYDALVLPGGVANPDELRVIPEAVKFVRSFFESHKPIAAICHGPWMLVEADIARGHTLTSWPSLKTDICNAGGTWVDREVVQDGLLTTSRKPNDLPAFIREMLKSFAASA
jgi:protease I